MPLCNVKLFINSSNNIVSNEIVPASGTTVHRARDEITRVRLCGFEPEAGARPPTSGLVLRIKGKRTRFIRPEPVLDSTDAIHYSGTLITGHCDTINEAQNRPISQ